MMMHFTHKCIVVHPCKEVHVNSKLDQDIQRHHNSEEEKHTHVQLRILQRNIISVQSWSSKHNKHCGLLCGLCALYFKVS